MTKHPNLKRALLLAPLAAIALAACSKSDAAAPPTTEAPTTTETPTTTAASMMIHIDYDLTVELTSTGDGCEDNGGYSDISSGAPATVQDGHGVILGGGVLQADSWNASATSRCVFTATFDVIPSTDGIYRITAGKDRGFLNHGEADIVGQRLMFDASIGL